MATVVFTVRTRGRSKFRSDKLDWMDAPAPDPNRLLSWKSMAEHVGVSLSTAKRMVGEGKLPKPQKIGLRKIGFRVGDIDAAVRAMK